MDNCYDIILENEDYTIGNILNYILYTIFYQSTKELSYCGFKKMHPHESDSIIRIAFNASNSNKTTIKTMFKYVFEEATNILKKIKDLVSNIENGKKK